MTEFRFTKGPGKVDWLDVLRADGRVERIDCPKQRIIPHDMIHHAIEAEIGAHGFMSRVGDGEAADFAMSGNAESDGVERLVEVAQAAAWSDSDDVDYFLDLYRTTCDARTCAPLPIDAAVVVSIQRRIADLQVEWDGLPVGGSMTLGNPHGMITG
ncbi:MAG: hypothetical protein K2P79_00020 [Sphingomonas sp.]|nr:hypothetical protein [Sphingomonas sp.]